MMHVYFCLKGCALDVLVSKRHYRGIIQICRNYCLTLWCSFHVPLPSHQAVSPQFLMNVEVKTSHSTVEMNMRGNGWPHTFSPWAMIMILVTSTEADYSTVASMLENIARVESVDVNVIGKFHQPLDKKVLRYCIKCYLYNLCKFY